MSRYRLDDLGWFEFERLCQALLQAAYGVTVEAWGGSGDHGRDAYTEADLNFPDRGAVSSGPFLFQVKFVQGANATGANPGPSLKKAVSAEIQRISERREDGDWSDPACYALMTNVPLSAASREAVVNDLKRAMSGRSGGCALIAGTRRWGTRRERGPAPSDRRSAHR
jgi:hypothetical protein